MFYLAHAHTGACIHGQATMTLSRNPHETIAISRKMWEGPGHEGYYLRNVTSCRTFNVTYVPRPHAQLRRLWITCLSPDSLAGLWRLAGSYRRDPSPPIRILRYCRMANVQLSTGALQVSLQATVSSCECTRVTYMFAIARPFFSKAVRRTLSCKSWYVQPVRQLTDPQASLHKRHLPQQLLQCLHSLSATASLPPIPPTPLLSLQNMKMIQNEQQNVKRYRLQVSDGTHFQPCMLATQMNEKLENGELDKYSVVQVNRYLCNTIHERRFGTTLLLSLSLSLVSMSTTLVFQFQDHHPHQPRGPVQGGGDWWSPWTASGSGPGEGIQWGCPWSSAPRGCGGRRGRRRRPTRRCCRGRGRGSQRTRVWR